VIGAQFAKALAPPVASAAENFKHAVDDKVVVAFPRPSC